jgi:hypothetical protein
MRHARFSQAKRVAISSSGKQGFMSYALAAATDVAYPKATGSPMYDDIDSADD